MDESIQALGQSLAIDPASLSDPDIVIRILVQVLLLVASAFFSSSETALFSISRLELRELRRHRHPKADILHAMLDQPRRLIISILCGNELINIAATANMTTILALLYSDQDVFLYNILIMVPLLLLLGEVTPKTIATTNPVAVSTRVIATPLAIWLKLVAPFRWTVRLLSERITDYLVGPEKSLDNILQVDEFRLLIKEVEQSGELHATERILIDNLLAAGSTEVVEIMIPRTRTAFINVELSIPEMIEQVRRFRHQRIPVYKQHRDTLVGMLHAEQLMQMVLDETDFDSVHLDEILHPVIMVPPTKKVDEMFDFFLRKQSQAAVVLNEFGGIDGMVTLKDVVNFIFGHVAGVEPLNQSFEEPLPGVFEIAGEMKLNDFNTITNFGIRDTRMTTISGVLLRHLDRLPAVGDAVSVDNICLEVIAIDGHRIERIRATPISAHSAETAKKPAESEALTEEPSRVDQGTEK